MTEVLTASEEAFLGETNANVASTGVSRAMKDEVMSGRRSVFLPDRRQLGEASVVCGMAEDRHSGSANAQESYHG